jgi:hypothetical protein
LRDRNTNSAYVCGTGTPAARVFAEKEHQQLVIVEQEHHQLVIAEQEHPQHVFTEQEQQQHVCLRTKVTNSTYL